MDSASSQTDSQGPQRPFRRQVFYLPGYDPFHPRRYRELYRKEAKAQAAVSGYDIALRARKGDGPYGWHVAARIDGRPSQVDMQVLVWADIVKASMAHGIAATYLQMLRTAWVYLASGALFRLMRLRKGPMIAALYPVAFLLGQLGIALLAGVGLAGELARGVHSAAGWVVGPPLVWLILRLFRRWDNKVFAYYLMHDYAYSAQARGATPPELQARMRAFQGQISLALAGNVDEVLVVGHSSGAHLGVSILADLVRQGLPARHPALSFLTLGQVVPMVSFLPEARQLRADLAYLSASDALTWIDISAPGDGCAFALCDPVAVSGVAPAGKRWPLILSAAFTQTLSPERWKALRWRFFRLHFQYMCAFDRPGDYDYFQITAGPMTLAQRYAGREPSKSRIETPLSGYTTTA